MLRQLIVYILIFTWSKSVYTFSINQWKVYVSGYGGLSMPAIKFRGDKQSTPITNNILRGMTLSIQPFQYTSIDITGLRFYDYCVDPESTSSPTFKGERYKTSLIDINLRSFLFHVTPNVRIYAKYGLWRLHNLRLVERKYPIGTKNIEPSSTSGYGIVIGPSTNWTCLPYTYSAFSIDCAALLYFPISTLPFFPKNYISHTFPLVKVGLHWQAW